MTQTSIDLCEQGDDEPFILHNLKILLVEDDSSLNEMLTDFLTSYCGAEVISVTLAAQALEAVQLQKPGILLTNIVLEDETGYSLIRKIRNLEPGQGREIPAIALTGVSETNRQRILEAGFQGYLAKPCRLHELIKVITSLTSSDSK